MAIVIHYLRAEQGRAICFQNTRHIASEQNDGKQTAERERRRKTKAMRGTEGKLEGYCRDRDGTIDEGS